MDHEIKAEVPKKSPAAAKTAVDSPNLEKVRQILKKLIKFISGKKLYAPNNPILARFAEELKSSLDDYFKDEDELVLSIHQFHINLGDEQVYENKKREESIAFLLYKDGVGEVSFRREIPFAEVEGFVDILTKEMHRTSREDDVVTKLWKADFNYISYRVLDEYLSGEFGDGEGTLTSSKPSALDSADHAELLSLFKDEGRVIVEPEDPLSPLHDYFRHLVEDLGMHGGVATNEKGLEDLLSTTFRVGMEELKLCNEELLDEKRKDSLLLLLKTMFEFSLLSDNPSVLRDIFNVLDNFIDYFAGLKQPHKLKEVLLYIREFAETPELKEDLRDYCRGKAETLTHKELLFSLAKGLSQWSKGAEDVLGYLEEVGKPSTDVLIKMLEVAANNRLRQEICDRLVRISGEKITSVIERIESEKWGVAIAVIYMTKSAGLKAIPQNIREFVYYPDIRVREELVKYLASSGNEGALALLVKATKDEEKRVRIKALGALVDKNDSLVKKLFHSLAFGKELARKDQDEKEIIFRALGGTGDSATIEKINEILNKRTFMHISKSRDNKLLAIRALEFINEPESIQLLQKLASDSNALVKSRAKKALSKLKQSCMKFNSES